MDKEKFIKPPSNGLDIRKITFMFPRVNVKTVEEYFALPIEKRQKFGIYLKPYALPFDIFNKKNCGWRKFKKEIRMAYPIQGWIREWLFNYDNPVYAFISRCIGRIRDIKHNIRRFLRPSHPRFRRVYRRHRWMDISDAILQINFALIQDFWHEEMKFGWVDWEGDERHKKFYEWIKNVVNYIEIERPDLLKQVEKAFDNINHELREPYDVKYKVVNELEAKIDKLDLQVLKNMIKYRTMFWT